MQKILKNLPTEVDSRQIEIFKKSMNVDLDLESSIWIETSLNYYFRYLRGSCSFGFTENAITSR